MLHLAHDLTTYYVNDTTVELVCVDQDCPYPSVGGHHQHVVTITNASLKK